MRLQPADVAEGAGLKHKLYAASEKMIEDKKAEPAFHIAGVLGTCLENGEATECSHNLMYLPPWKSLVTLNQMAALAANKETFQMEVYGIISGTGNEYIPRKLIDASLQRATVEELFLCLQTTALPF